jgi:predicted ATP-grasp superfamily ATP-dependent carboligase
MDHYGALGVMRSLGRLGVQVYGVHAVPDPTASYSKYCRGLFKWDLDRASAADSVDYLLNAAESIGGRPLMIATNDETALFIAENAVRLKEAFVFPYNPPALVRSLYNKKQMYFLSKQLAIPTAETVFPLSKQELVEFCRNVRYPVLLKASDNAVTSRRSGRKMAIVHSERELLETYDRMEDPDRPGLMLQEYIPGKDDSVWMFNGYFDENSRCLFGITGRKIHQTPVYTGMTALGVCLENPDVRELTTRLMSALGYKGILDIGFRYDARDGKYKLLDVNPRLGATFRLFVGTGGMDVVRAEYLDFTGQRVPQSSICAGRKWIVEDADVVSAAQYYRDRALTLRECLGSYRGIQEGAWFAGDDWSPFLHLVGGSFARVFRRLYRSVSGGRFAKACGT